MQKTFGDILSDIQNKTRTSRLICVSMLIAGVILLAFKHSIGWLFVLMGCAMVVSLYSKSQSLSRELDKITDMDSFVKEYDSGDSVHLELLGLTIAGDYVVKTLPVLRIYPLRQMNKFEVGLQGDIRKALFLTDGNGTRHKIAETQKGDALQEEFDKAYEAVRSYFSDRDQ